MVEKITRQMLRDLPLGETKVYQLSDAKACLSGRAVAAQVAFLTGDIFRTSLDKERLTLTVTRLPAIVDNPLTTEET